MAPHARYRQYSDITAEDGPAGRCQAGWDPGLLGPVGYDLPARMNEPSPKTLAAVLAEFGVDSEVPSVTPLGHGHIHDTYLVQGPEPPLVLQRINAGVFPFLGLNAGCPSFSRCRGRPSTDRFPS